MRIYIKSNMLVIQTTSSILNIKWFGSFVKTHSKDTIFMPMSLVVFYDVRQEKERKKFLFRLAHLYSRFTSLSYEKLLLNLIKYLKKPIKIEFKQQLQVKGDIGIYLDALSPSQVRILLQEPNPWVFAYFASHLERYITDSDDRNIFIDASNNRGKSRLDRVLKRKSVLFFNLKYEYSRGFLSVLFTEYTRNSKKKYEEEYGKQQSNKYGFNSKEYCQDSTLLRYYRTLELPYGASWDDVKKNYRKLAKMYHPDRVHHKNESLVEMYTKKFQDIQESYNFLKEYLGK